MHKGVFDFQKGEFGLQNGGLVLQKDEFDFSKVNLICQNELIVKPCFRFYPILNFHLLNKINKITHHTPFHLFSYLIKTFFFRFIFNKKMYPAQKSNKLYTQIKVIRKLSSMSPRIYPRANMQTTRTQPLMVYAEILVKQTDIHYCQAHHILIQT